MISVTQWPIIRTHDGYFRCVNHDEKLLSTGFKTEEKMIEYAPTVRVDQAARNLMAARYAEAYMVNPDGGATLRVSAISLEDTQALQTSPLRATAHPLVARMAIIVHENFSGFAGVDSKGCLEDLASTDVVRMAILAANTWPTGDQLPEFAGALDFARYVEQTHINLLRLDRDGDLFYGSNADYSLGNIVFFLCAENGVILDDEDGYAYCSKATSVEICEYNLGRITEALAAQDEHGLATLRASAIRLDGAQDWQEQQAFEASELLAKEHRVNLGVRMAIIAHSHFLGLSGDESKTHLKALNDAYDDDLLEMSIGVTRDALLAAELPEFASPLQFAQYVEETHAELLRLDSNGDRFYGSTTDIALGNVVFFLCEENGVDLEDDDGYCQKATSLEICEYNLGRIKDVLAEKNVSRPV